MSKFTARSGIVAALLALVATGLTSPAQAATAWSYVATAGGTYVQALDATVSSDLTAQSGVTGGPAGTTNSNSIASVNALGVVSTGVVTTNASSTAVTGGVKVTSTAKTAGLKLLGGLITADAIETTASTTGAATTAVSGGTKFVNLKIVGVNLPLNIPQNYSVTIPGVAQIGINGLVSAEKDGGRATQAWGLGIVLLKDVGSERAGARIFVNPLFQMVTPTPPSEGANIAGTAFGTHIRAAAGSAAQVYSGPTARVNTPYTSSFGKTLTNSTASVNVPGVLTVGAVSSATTSTKSGASDAEIINSNQTAKVNVLGGLITADAIKVVAHGKRVSGNYTSGMKMTLVNLKVAGTVIPLDIKPNTTINVANLGKVVINQQIQQGGLNLIRGVYVTLSTAQAGLPVGATIEIAAAATQIS